MILDNIQFDDPKEVELTYRTLEEVLTTLDHPIVRDLAWVIGAPDLLFPSHTLPTRSSKTARHSLQCAQLWLLTLNKDPEPLIDALSKYRDVRLGAYVEQLVIFWLTHHPDVIQVKESVHIQDEKQTLGALDLLVQWRQTPDQSYWEHWELTIKYYLCVNRSESWSRWVGPNRRDHLLKKLTRMMSHQLPLSSKPITQSKLQQIGVVDVQDHVGEQIQTRAWIKGIFFDEWTPSSQSPPCAPQGGASARGLWVTRSLLPMYIQSQHKKCCDLSSSSPQTLYWIRCDKPHWLAHVLSPDSLERGMRSIHSKLKEYMTQSRPLEMIYGMDLCLAYERDVLFNIAQVKLSSSKKRVPSPVFMYSCLSSTQPHKERHRLFVVPDGWFDEV